MNKDQYYQFAFERLGKEFPDLVVKVEYRPKDCSTSYMVSLDSDKENPFKDPHCSSVDFFCMRKDDCLSHVWLRLIEERRDKGLGRRLVQFLHEAAEEIGRPRLCVNVNVNESFWKHMGFEPMFDTWIKDVA